MRLLAAHMSRRPGPAAGMVLWAALAHVRKMLEESARGSVVMILPDAADHYLSTVYSDNWLARTRLDVDSYQRQLQEFLSTLQWPAPAPTPTPAAAPVAPTPSPVPSQLTAALTSSGKQLPKGGPAPPSVSVTSADSTQQYSL